MYNYLLSILKKRAPYLYKILKKLKNKLFFDKKFIQKLNKENEILIKSIEKESYYDFKKKEFFENKDKKSKLGIL